MVMEDIWKKEKFDSALYEATDNFFENILGKKELEYREGQHTMALDIVDSITNRSILLIEAGTGTGKSFAYLVPLIYATEYTKDFKGFIISTSSIALQEQLKNDIKKASSMLGIDIPVTIVKGKSNYLCQKRLEYFSKRKENASKVASIKARVKEGKIDRRDFEDISNVDWKKLNVDKVSCSDCMYRSGCQYVLKRKEQRESKVIITNHDYLISEQLKKDEAVRKLNEPSIIIFDEAHTLPEKFRNAYKKTITKASLEKLVYDIYDQTERNTDKDISLLNTINETFRRISTRAKTEYKNNSTKDVETLDSETTGFNCTPTIKAALAKLIEELNVLIEETKEYGHMDSKLAKQLYELGDIKALFSDLLREPKNRSNVYWASFLPNTNEHIQIEYLPKNLSTLIGKSIARQDCGMVFTSASLTTSTNNYGYFKQDLGLDDITGKSAYAEDAQDSPYDYDKNALLYIATDVVSPKSKDHDLYLDSLAAKVEELMDVTGGRSLVLFTAKSDMKAVHERLMQKKKPYNILLQEDGMDAENLKEAFKEDETSCLLATGAFWEGIDVKGKSLENVIVAKLPFPTVDPIVQEKASRYVNGFEEVYLKEMLLKLKQGTGRLIRSNDDKGIVAILDPRAKDYAESILEALPYKNVTGQMYEVTGFACKNLMPELDDHDVKIYVKKDSENK